MKKTLRNALLIFLAMVLVATASIFGTIAYLQDDDMSINVMTLGNVKIEQIELERVFDDNGNLVGMQTFTQGQPLYPAINANGVSGNQIWAPNPDVDIMYGDYVDGFVGGNGTWQNARNTLDKFVFVKNTGESDAYYRTIILYEYDKTGFQNANGQDLIHFNVNAHQNFTWSPEDGDPSENTMVVEVNGVTYGVMVATYNKALTSGEVSRPSLLQVGMDQLATNEHCAQFGKSYDILVLSQAVQTAGFDDAESALNVAFGEINAANVADWFDGTVAPSVVNNAEELGHILASGNDVVLTDDIANAPADNTAPYGNYYGVAQNGGVFDGGNNTLDFDLGLIKNGKYDNYGIMTSGGTIKNVTVTGIFRGIMIMNPAEDIILDNVTVGADEDMCYGINTAEGNGLYSLIVSNSNISGWNSLGTAIKDASFTNCSFGQGTYYTGEDGRLLKSYVSTTLENCSFIDNFYLDLSSLEAGATIVIKNCTVNGQKLEASVIHSSTNWSEFEGKTFFVELPTDGRTLSDCIVFE